MDVHDDATEVARPGIRLVPELRRESRCKCEFVRFPELAVTNLAFGGPDLRTVWATASSSGRLYRMRWPRAGLALSYQEGIAP